MSQENVEIVRPSLEAWKTDDIDALVELCHPSVIMLGPGNWANETPTCGRDEVEHFFGFLRWVADPGSAPMTSLVDADDRVLARLSMRA
jgi:ketosteroid isomerase-like protein